MTTTDRRSWKLVAPWYRWERQRGETPSRAPRETRPVLQKYQTPDPVTVFLKDPQLSLKFGLEDYVYDLLRLGSLPRINNRRTRWSDDVLVNTHIRKLYLGAHRRAYLVVCALHCDAPGFPRVSPDQACEAGFVVRRRSLRVSPDALPHVVPLLQRIRMLSTQVALLSRRASERASRRGVMGPALASIVAARAPQLEVVKAQLAAAHVELFRWKIDSGTIWVSQGWIPSEVHGIGAWEPVEDRPPVVREAVCPLHPLIPDPADTTHSGTCATIYFGVIPTGGADTDAQGTPRLDDEDLYEIRCFVRRHRPECPKTGQRNDCRGELVWTEATEPYRLAAPTDLGGTANAPLTVKMPDLPKLAAEVAQRPFGNASPVQLKAPAGSGFRFSVVGGLPVLPSLGPDVMRLAAPLTTAVAAFLLQLFLPMVVTLFQLHPLLLLKFSVPKPDERDIPTALAQAVAQLDAGISLEGNTQIRSQVTQWLKSRLGNEIGGKLAADYGTGLLARLERDFLSPPPAPDLTALLEYEERVERHTAVATAALA